MKSMISYLCKLSLLLCLCFFMSCAKQTIINNVKEREANKIIVILSSKNINAVKIQAASTGAGGGSKTVLYNIQVDKDSSIEAMAILNKYGLPKKEELSYFLYFQEEGRCLLLLLKKFATGKVLPLK